jgi:hypothetical protein
MKKTADFPGCGLSTRTLGSPLVVVAKVVGVPLFNKRKKNHCTGILYSTTGDLVGGTVHATGISGQGWASGSACFWAFRIQIH